MRLNLTGPVPSPHSNPHSLCFFLQEKIVASVSTESKQREVGYLGKQIFELSNHLGNILATITDKKLQVSTNTTSTAYFEADVQTVQDYYAFGMQMPGRKLSGGYRYGFNGKENDNEVKGEGNQQDYGMRICDGRIGKFLSVDPITSSYPMLTPYQFSSNRPIDGIDLDGLEYKSAANWAEKNIANYSYTFHYNLDAPPSFKKLKQSTWKDVIGKTMYCATSTSLAYAQGDDKVSQYLGTNGYKSNRYGQLEFFEKGGSSHSLIKSKEYQKADRGDLIFMDNPDKAGEAMMGHVAILATAPRRKSEGKYLVNVYTTNAGASSDPDRHNSFGEAIYMVEKKEDGNWMLTNKWYKDVDSDKFVNKDMKDEKLIIQGFGRVEEEKVKRKK